MRRSRMKHNHSRMGGHNMLSDCKCWVCGADIIKSYPATDIMSWRFCHDHWLEHTKEYKELLDEYIKLKHHVMFERAMRFMERAGVDMTEYKRTAIAVRRHSEDNPELYKSSHEMITAVILLKADIDFEINYKIGKYCVDFFIPDWDLVVEIDGQLHEHSLLKDSNRDVEIRRELGEEWEIIRIPTKHVEQNPVKLPEAIQALAKQKRDIRKKNGGFLPQSYSKREAARYKKAMVYDEIYVKA